MTIPIKAFTATSNGLQRVLVSKVSVATPFDPKLSKPPSGIKEFDAIWDTGATNCVISKKVVDELGLKAITMREVHHGGGKEMCNVYLVSIFLPHHVVFPQVLVTECKLTGSDILIGMDVINRGDFAVTNFEGKTTFSFRMPSIKKIDFVEEIKKQPTLNMPTVGRNDLCPCGSGKKFKRCHWDGRS